MFDKLIETKVDVDAGVNEEGMCPLMISIEKDNLYMIDTLIKNGATVSCTRKSHSLPTNSAAGYSSDIEAAIYSTELTPLMLACCSYTANTEAVIRYCVLLSWSY
jgi:hypothetical protein